MLKRWFTGASELHHAAQRGEASAVYRLLGQGADVHAQRRNGFTALHDAAAGGYTTIVRMLLDHGAVVEVPARVGAKHTGVMPLHLAADAGHRDTVAYLLSSGANPRSAGPGPAELERDDWRALHWAAYRGKLAVVELLLDRGAPLDPEDSVKWTPLFYAVMEGHVDVVECLVVRGANVHVMDDEGDGPISLAKAEHLQKIVALLERHRY